MGQGVYKLSEKEPKTITIICHSTARKHIDQKQGQDGEGTSLVGPT